MATISTLCVGCGKTFKSSGYWSHLTQSNNTLCKTIASRHLQDKGARHAGTSLGEGLGMQTDLFEGASSFGGDLFGSADVYMDDDFGQVDDEITQTENELELAQEDEESAEQRAENYDLEESWEPPRPGASSEDEIEYMDAENGGLVFDSPARLAAEGRINGSSPRVIRYSRRFPNSRAGSIVFNGEHGDNRYGNTLGSHINTWAPFRSQIDWQVARWAKLRGPGSTAFSELLDIEGVREALKLSYKNAQELNKIIDKHLPSRPRFQRHEVIIGEEPFELYARDIVECLKALWGDPDFLPFLVFEPERHYADDEHKMRLYHDMHTAKWWWDTQRRVEQATKKSGITIVPVILSSDKTQLTVFRNKLAYPVYLTIGNLPKHIRRKPSRQGQVLLAYLPTSKLEHIKNKAGRRRAVANLFHACMAFLVKPLETLGTTGLPMTSGDGAVRDCHPIVAAFAGDYPEQVLVTCTKTRDCPTCPAPRRELGNSEDVEEPRQIGPILDALDKIAHGPVAFTEACKNAGIKPIQRPFWQHLPFLNIYRSITPDLLHQMYQGNVKHLINWVKKACGESEIDARCRRLPPNHHIRLFLKGISHLNRVTGTEHDQICRFLLTIVIDIRIPSAGRRGTAQLVRTVRNLLDFLYLAKYPVHSTETLDLMEKALKGYHNNRQIFIDLNIRQDFNFPKAHFIKHYRELIEVFGTTDNFNTEYTERLHIDLAKEAYRATNSKDEYPQMTAWLDRRERIFLHEKFIRRRLRKNQAPVDLPQIPPLVYPRQMMMTKWPSVNGVSINDVTRKYGAVDFQAALSRFVISHRNPTFSLRQVENAVVDFHMPFQKISVFHRIKFVSRDPYSVNPLDNIVVDSIHCEPSRLDKNGSSIPGRFDTAIVNISRRPGIRGCCVGQVRCVFTLPLAAQNAWFPAWSSPIHLGYVEWFTPFDGLRPGREHGLYKISRSVINGKRRSTVIPISLIQQSVHLTPSFGPVAPADWRSSTVLENASSFFVNVFPDRFSYTTIH